VSRVFGFARSAGTRSRGISLRCNARRSVNPREIPRLRPAPAKTTGTAKARATPLGMTFVCVTRRQIYSLCGKVRARGGIPSLQRAAFARSGKKIANQRNAQVEGR
jgi:hypothetical protein